MEEDAAALWADSILAQLSQLHADTSGERDKERPLPAPPKKRFSELATNQQIQDLQKSCVPKTTSRSTLWTLNLWKEWSKNRQEMGADK